MNKKIAYLIIAHNNFKQLLYLVTLLDNDYNDIFILVDKKANIEDDVMEKIKSATSYSNVFFIERIKIYWGDYSLIEAELSLFKAAFNNFSYSHYILISGVDLPLVSQDYIFNFLNNNPNKIFIGYGKKVNDDGIVKRIRYNHISPRLFGRNNLWRPIRLSFKLLDNIYIYIQRVFKVDKIKKYHLDIDYASNWVILDSYTVTLLLKYSLWIKKIFKHSLACDEVFIPTLINKLKLNRRVYSTKRIDDMPNTLQGNLDYINWWDGSPYVWKDGDEKKLKKAVALGHLFSRKFDIYNSNSKNLKKAIESMIKDN